MIRVITDAKRIKKYNTAFKNSLDKELTEFTHCFVSYPSGRTEADVKYSPELNIWVAQTEYHNRFWNGFGIGKPIVRRNNTLVGEINFPYSGIDRRIGGVFAQDDNGDILILHRGKIGGGKRGIGKKYFLDNCTADIVSAIDDKSEEKFCLVGSLNSTLLPQQTANFINEIYRVKHFPQSHLIFDSLTNFVYSDEHSGKIITERTEQIIINRTHGIVVNALSKELQNLGYKTGNDKNRDLFIHENDKITRLFEIKTSIATQCLYASIGQLLIYSIPIRNNPQLIAMFPDKLNIDVEKRFAELGITILYYSWKDEKPIFQGLENL